MFDELSKTLTGIFIKRRRKKGSSDFKFTPPAPKDEYNSPAEKMRRAERIGHKKFTIDGQTIYALNEKNARRKLAKAH